MARRPPVPVVLQMEAAECGAASLTMLLAYHGRWVSLEKVRADCGVSRDGSKASNVLRAARAYGMEAKGFKKDLAGLRAVPLPAIIHWNFNHFLVLEAFTKDGAQLVDPALGRRTVDAEVLDQSFTGVVLTFRPTADFQPGGQPPRAIRGLLDRLGGLGPELGLLSALSVLLVVPGLVLPSLTRIFVDDVIMDGRREWLLPVLGGVFALGLYQAALSWMRSRRLRGLYTYLSITSTARFVWHAFRLPVAFYQARYAGDVTHRVSANDGISRLIADELSDSAALLLQVVVFGLLLLVYATDITLAVFALTLVQIWVSREVAARGKAAYQVYQQESGILQGVSMGGLQSIENTKASGSENDFFQRWAGHFVKEQNAATRHGLFAAVAEAVTALARGLTHAIILTFGGYKVMQGEMTVGDIVAFETLLLSFLTPIRTLIAAVNSIEESEVDLTRLGSVTGHSAAPEAMPQGGEPDLTTDTATSLTGRLEIRDLTFGYAALEAPLVQGVSLTVEPGERVAIVGGSGSGKSTVLRLVAGLYTPWAGEILFDGQPRRALPRRLLTRDISYVDQSSYLFDGTIRDNLTLWDETVTEEAIIRAAKDAEMHLAISERAGGYDSRTTEGGGNFSGGQRQRLELARALVSDPALLILDEATSALDPRVETIIDANLRRRGCACLIVAHRLSTIKDCDQIIVMERGRIVERGTHHELMAAGGAYVALMGGE